MVDVLATLLCALALTLGVAATGVATGPFPPLNGPLVPQNDGGSGKDAANTCGGSPTVFLPLNQRRYGGLLTLDDQHDWWVLNVTAGTNYVVRMDPWPNARDNRLLPNYDLSVRQQDCVAFLGNSTTGVGSEQEVVFFTAPAGATQVMVEVRFHTNLNGIGVPFESGCGLSHCSPKAPGTSVQTLHCDPYCGPTDYSLRSP